MDFATALKKSTNASLNSKTLLMARSLDINGFQTADALMAEEARRQYRQRWSGENQEAIAQYNARIAAEGTFAQQVQRWMQNDASI